MNNRRIKPKLARKPGPKTRMIHLTQIRKSLLDIEKRLDVIGDSYPDNSTPQYWFVATNLLDHLQDVINYRISEEAK